MTTTDPIGLAILDSLASVAQERALRAAEAGLAARTLQLKSLQQDRFRRAYADLLAAPRYAGAARFFLDELYGPRDYTQRDTQFQRIVRPLVKLFPSEVVDTVHQLAMLHALSEKLDTRMAQQLPEGFGPSDYVRAWVAVGDAEARARQVQLTLKVGRALDVYTRKPLLRHALRLMRGPASAAGLSALQQFLEAGFDTFRAMRGADYFLASIEGREQEWARNLFAGDPEGRFVALWS
jgi:hypothetical protein